ncbi:hypothetical protein C0Q70_08365 [Pomacea canaliculata]|uniref:FAD-binding PCMH-type domain-containing protein n=1 Tax=Pomacea canaliculata TaxID=400727 RepID=A0A2T7PHM2_POMCA|nr:hypothetical protein C0Q70_08365 [Pomacea canaliculata]
MSELGSLVKEDLADRMEAEILSQDMRSQVLLACLACVLIPAVRSRSLGVKLDDLTELEDTVVRLGDEPLQETRRARRAISALTDIMGPLVRHARDVSEQERSQAVYERMRSLLALLRMLLGNSVQVQIMQFMNWDRTIEIDQVFYTAPKTIWEVRRIILAARQLGMRVRATGVGHSRSPLYVDEGNIMMDVRGLQRHDGPRIQLNQPTVERKFRTVTAMTGVIEHELNKFLTDNMVTMLSQPLNDVESFGGMVAANTHGSTWSAPAYSGYVVEMRLVDSSGRLRRFTKERHPDIMRAAMCNLGMFGIMYDITIQVYDTFKAKVENFFVPLGDLIYNTTRLRETVTGNFLTEISWFPFNSVTQKEAEEYIRTQQIPSNWTAKRDIVWLRHINKATEQETAGKVMQPALYLPTNGSLSGGNVEGLLRGKGALEIAQKLESPTYHYLVNAFPVILPPRWGTETSAAFLLNIDNSFDRAAEALKFMIERAERQIKDNGTTPLNALLPRFFHNSDCLLCPGNTNIRMNDDSNRTLVIDFLAPPSQYGFYAAAREFVYHFRNQKVRPHWGKRHDNIPGIIDIIHEVYGDLVNEFSRMRVKARVDPCDMFMNSYLLQIFGRSTDCI